MANDDEQSFQRDTMLGNANPQVINIDASSYEVLDNGNAKQETPVSDGPGY